MLIPELVCDVECVVELVVHVVPFVSFANRVVVWKKLLQLRWFLLEVEQRWSLV